MSTPDTARPLVAVARLATSDADLGAHGLLVLLALAARADARGECWPAMATIARDSRVSVRTARSTVAELVRLRLVTVTRRRAEEGRQGTSVYRLEPEAMLRRAAAAPRVREVHPGEPSVQDVPPTSVQRVQSGTLPECTERPSRVQETSLQSAPRADKQAHEQAHEQAQRERARARGEDGPEVQERADPSEPSARPPPESAPASRVVDAVRRPPPSERPLYVRRQEQTFVTAAFAEGVREATGSAYVVPAAEIRDLDNGIDGFAPTREGEARDAWLRASAKDFRRAIRNREQYHRGGGPRGWLEWLGMGAPSAEWLAMTPAQREEHAADEARRKAAADRRARPKLLPPPISSEPPISPEQATASLERLFAPFGGFVVAPPRAPSSDTDEDPPFRRALA